MVDQLPDSVHRALLLVGEMMSPSGEIQSAEDYGTIWSLLYKQDGDGLDNIYLDHRCFEHLYDGLTGRSFCRDYRFGRGTDFVSRQLEGLRIEVGEGKQWVAPADGASDGAR